MFRALVVREEEGRQHSAIERWDEQQLPANPLLVAVRYSSLNYKDGLAVTGKGKILKQLPMIPGIDLVGEVLRSDTEEFKTGDQVLLTGGGLGERYCGGFAERARIETTYAIPLPAPLTAWQSMAIGTAGFTAMLAVMALAEAGVKPASGPIAVSGAAGGVGSMAVLLLAGLGFEVAAITGREETHAYLRNLGAHEILNRSELEQAAKPLETQRWAGAIDIVGGPILARLLAQTQAEGAVCSCGLAASAQLRTSVLPFILRGVRLLGINSVQVPQAHRRLVWQRLLQSLDLDRLAALSATIGLDQVPHYAELITQGQVRGRLVIDLENSD